MDIKAAPLCFTCAKCGRCCRDWGVEVEDALVDGLNRLDWPELPKDKKVVKSGKKWFMRHNPDGTCIFLKDNTCLIHSRLGKSAKPLTCRMFPYFLTLAPDGMNVGLTYACPSAAANVGGPIGSDDNLTGMAEDALKFDRVARADPKIFGRKLTWDEYLLVESKILEVFSKSAPLKDRLLGSHQFLEGLKAQPNLQPYLKSASPTPKMAVQDYEWLRRVVLGIAWGLTRDEGRHSSIFGPLGKYLSFLKTGVMPGEKTRAAEVKWVDSEMMERFVTQPVINKNLAVGDVSERLNMLILAYALAVRLAKSNASKNGRDSVSEADLLIALPQASRFTSHTGISSLKLYSSAAPLIRHYFGDPTYAEAMLFE
jgi:Fe-S-cluster containining protein